MCPYFLVKFFLTDANDHEVFKCDDGKKDGQKENRDGLMIK